jgi:L-fuculose-phosphate aldolase
MLLVEERKKLVEFGKRLYRDKLTRGTGGNLSIYNSELELMAITPSGIAYEELEYSDIVIMNLIGEVVEGKLKPSSENPMHRKVYQNRKEFKAMIHTHSTYAVVLSVLRKPLLAIDYLVALSGGKDVRLAEYASFGSNDLSSNALSAMEERCAVLLANHGMNVCADSLETAYAKLEILEFCCELYVKALSAGTPVILDDSEMEKMVKEFKHYGQK